MLSGYRAVVFVLLVDCAFADPFPVDPASDEDQPLIGLLDHYVENVHKRVLRSTGYERLRVVVNASEEVLEFFKFMGYLLLNGTLGECVDGAWTARGNYCTIHISSNRSRFGVAVADFLAEDRDENMKDVENFPLLVLPEWETGRDNARWQRSYLKDIFSETWSFFDHMQGHLAEANPVDDGLIWHAELPVKCHYYNGAQSGDDVDQSIMALVGLVGPGCDKLDNNSVTSWPPPKKAFRLIENTKQGFEEFAGERGFNGGTSNRCLHKFVIRYNNYSAEAYESFVANVAKFLYWDAIGHGICLSINPFGELVDAAEANRRRDWVMHYLASIGDSLLDVDSVLAETPPPYWIIEAKPVMENVIGNETVPYPSSADAARLYKAIHNGFQAGVRGIPGLRIKNLSDLFKRTAVITATSRFND